MAVSLWLSFAPTKVGGSVTYLTIVGRSMEPVLHRGDLAMVRAEDQYRVGDAVLYHSSVLRRPVLHRIVAIQQGRYFFKGDNNDFADPGSVPASALVGRLWLRAPHVGAAASWLGEPAHAGVIAALAALLIGGGLTSAGHVRRRRPGAPSSRRIPMRPTTVPKPVVGAFALLLIAGACLAVGFTEAVQRTVPRPDAYRHTGTFSYSAPVTSPNVAFPSGRATTGQPLFFDLFENISLDFRYRFASRLPHAVEGTVSLNAQISDPTGWRNLYQLQPATPFQGDVARVGGRFPLSALRRLIEQLGANSAMPNAEYLVGVQTVVHVKGVVDGHRVDTTFSPVLPFSVTNSLIKVNAQPASLPPGATYAPATADPIHPSRAASVPTMGPNVVTIAGHEVRVTVLRAAGVLLAWLAVMVLVLCRLLGGRRPEGDPVHRLARGCVFVEVDSLRDVGDRTVAVRDPGSLVRVALHRDQPILQCTSDAGTAYAVRDGELAYVFTVVAPPVVPVAVAAPRSRNADEVVRRRGRRRRAVTVLGSLVLVPVLVGCVVLATFAAGNTVPTSFVGRTIRPKLVAELVPPQCASIAPTNLVVGTGLTITGTSGNDLIIGRTGVFGTTLNYDGGGGNDCIVAGGTFGVTNIIDGGTGTNICIAPAFASNTLKRC